MTNTDRLPSLSKKDIARYKLLRDIGILVLVIICGFLWISSMLNDITGEYTTNDPTLGIVSVSLVRKDTNIFGELSCGRGAILEAEVPFPQANDRLDLNFELPKRWLIAGKLYRKVEFHGKVRDGTISGVLEENGEVYPIKLERNTLSTIRRHIQTLIPWLD